MNILLYLSGLLLKVITVFVVFLLCVYIVLQLVTNPSNTRNWNTDQKILSYGEIKGDLVTLQNIRNFTYASTTDYVQNYYNKTFDLQKIKKVWYIVEPFSGIPGSAHTFLSFEFENNEFISVSIEIRKEQGESFHPIKGLFNQYEIMYVWGDEKDLIKLRSNYRNDKVYVYPMKATKEKVQALFLDMIQRTNTIKDNPEFYNTVTNTCTTNIVKHVNVVTPKKVPLLNLSVFFPEGSDKLAYQLGLIDTTLSFEDARKKFYINDLASTYADDDNFSVKIRGEE
jgi:hypothetical protein